MHIIVDNDLRPTIAGQRIDTAFTVPQLHLLLGKPSRVLSGKTPAPVGHRNNQIHLYDQLGVYFYEHHYTRKIAGCKISFAVEKAEPFVPASCYDGQLEIAGHPLTAQTDFTKFPDTLSGLFERNAFGWYRAVKGDFSVIIIARTVALSWPHDPWRQPAGG